MNEQLQKLYEQSFVIDSYVNVGPDGATLGIKFDPEKFAELIVRECIKKCQDHPSIIFKNEWDADVVAPDIVNRLESHFGVEE